MTTWIMFPDEERAAMNKAPLDAEHTYLTWVLKLLCGENVNGYMVFEQIHTPHSGSQWYLGWVQGEGAKTVLPCKASGNISKGSWF
ncbi:MAG: hypothetical protein IPJ13_31860 [Saprospiraceae bacterium]|nr:hypothetical protein [Saprospiraceae bacterium]